MLRIVIICFLISLTILTAVVTLQVEFYLSDAFESLCIKGRISAEQADTLNKMKWQKKPSYCSGRHGLDKTGALRDGQSHCDAERYDRVLAAHCSQFTKVMRRGD